VEQRISKTDEEEEEEEERLSSSSRSTKPRKRRNQNMPARREVTLLFPTFQGWIGGRGGGRGGDDIK